MIGHTETVTAISTPPGKGGVAVIRISGEDALSVAEKCFLPRSGKSVSSLPARTAIYGDIILDGKAIDDGILLLFRAPHSYTGEDTVELTCHGGPLLTGMVLEATLKAGASPAPAGEFTRRAYLNNKLNLSDAEAIGLAIDAVTPAQVSLAARDSRNALSDAVSLCHDRLNTLLASLYAVIDYPDEDLAELSPNEVIDEISDILKDLGKLRDTYRTGRAIREGIPAVLAGKPNVGKSALFNRLLGEEAAIVTPIPGTTRDVIEHRLAVGRVLLRIADTAGVHDTVDPVEKIGVARSRDRIAKSELFLLVLDTSRPLDEEDIELLKLASDFNGKVVLLLNKADLSSVWDETELDSYLPIQKASRVTLSAESGKGFEELTALLEREMCDASLKIGEDAVVATARQATAISNACTSLSEAVQAFKNGVPVDASASLAEAALADLSEVDGRSVSEEIVNSIFSRFCVGK